MPLKELERLQAVNRFLKLEISKEKELQNIVNFAAEICDVPAALITFIDDDTQHIRFQVGAAQMSSPRESSFCSHAIRQNEVLIIPDALLDERFINNPFVCGEPNIRFYAGAPLITADGYKLGSLCVIDRIPKQLTCHQQKMLSMLSKQVIQLLEFDSSLTILKDQFIKAKQAEIELRSFFESSIDCHLLLGKDFDILAFNKALKRLVVKTRGITLKRGDHMSQYLHPNLREGFYLNYLKALKGTATFEQRKLDYDTEVIHWLIKYEPALNKQGEIIGVSVNSSDITLRVEHEETVEQQANSLSEIAFIQSHELRRPVASIIGLLDLIKIDGRANHIEEFDLMQHAVAELDEKIHLVINHTAVAQ